MNDLGLVGGYGFGYDIGVGLVNPAEPVVKADPTKDYVSFPVGWGLESPSFGSPLRTPLGWHGLAEYEAMQNTPAVGSSFNALRAAVLAGGVGLLPAVKPASSSGEDGEDPATDLDSEMAVLLCDANRRMLEAWDTPVDLVLWEMMEAMYKGHALAEVRMDDVLDGPEAGLLGIRSLRTLPRHAYRFLLDEAGQVARIGARTRDGWKEFEPGHFAWITWDGLHGDPRGRSLFRMAHFHWRMLMDLWPEVFKGWKQFGTPILYGTTAPGEGMVTPLDPKTGAEVAGSKPYTAEYALAMRMHALRNGAVAAGKNGSDVKVVESSKDSSVVAGAVSILEGQIIRAILLQLRATMEAQHGSKADSQTGQDVMGTLVRFVRKWVERFLRSVLMRQNALNYGDDIARRLTPLVDLGGAEHHDFAANSAGAGLLYQAGYFTDDMLPEVDVLLGFSPRQRGAQRVGPTGPIPDVPPEQDQPAEPAPAGGVAA